MEADLRTEKGALKMKKRLLSALLALCMTLALCLGTAAPAMACGLDAGVIETGKPADLVLLDDGLNILSVFVDGKRQ